MWDPNPGGLGFRVLKQVILKRAQYSGVQVGCIPIGPKVVPFWDYLIEFLI